jgi:ribosomal protein S15
VIEQQKRKKAANLTRRASLEQQRVESLGDPVRGLPTPFVESFATGIPVPPSAEEKGPQDEFHLNYALKPADLSHSLEKSKDLATPRVTVVPTPTYSWSASLKYNRPDAPTPEEVQTRKEEDHQRASEAIARITALENGSSKDRMRVNIARCVSTFGRHKTDRIFPPRAPPLPHTNSTAPHPIRPKTNIEATKKRVGPDTGSSEVQIAILTAKIKTVADFLASRGKNDKHNKRNLRLLVHRRQKLLNYFKRKERGGPRWQHCIETLGLTEGTWQGEISL